MQITEKRILMKKNLMIALTICMTVLLAGCGKSANNGEGKKETPVTAESATSQTKESETSASTEAPGETEEFKILNGKIKRVSENMDKITVLNDNIETIFNLNNVVVETSYALEPDVAVSIIYKGEISGSDTTNAKVVLVLDAQKSMEIKEMTGSVKDQAMSTFLIEGKDGSQMGFMKDNCEGLDSGVLGKATDDSNGSGDMVKVTYVTVTYDAGSKSNFPLKVEAVK